MPAVNKTTVFLSGKVYWAKITGEPRPNYEGTAREWTMEFEPNEAGAKVIEQHKLADRFKTKEGRGKYLVLRKKEFSQDGNPNTPIRIYDEDNNDWDKSKLIGNASDADVKVDIRDYGVGKKKGIYPVALRVTGLIEYQSADEFSAMDKGDGNEVKAAKPKGPAPKRGFAEDLDDDLPF